MRRICRIVIFNKNNIFYCGQKILMFDQRKPFMDELVELSCKLKKDIYIYIYEKI